MLKRLSIQQALAQPSAKMLTPPLGVKAPQSRSCTAGPKGQHAAAAIRKNMYLFINRVPTTVKYPVFISFRNGKN